MSDPLSFQSALGRFSQPPASFRGKPFWSWNGRLNKAELIRQIRLLKKMGHGGFFMHSRTGLVTEYLGDEWFELVNACADEAEKLGLEAWLYDEDRWPSGSAGGLATRREDLRMKYLRLRIVEPAAFQWPAGASFVAAFAATVDGINFSDCERLAPDFNPTQMAGRKVLWFEVETMPSHSFYNGYAYLDTMKREATDEFLRVTHEKYLSHCGNRLGKSIKGIFTDEPHRGMVMIDRVDQGAGADPEWLAPWTEALPEEFESRFGLSLVDSLPDLFLRRDGKRFSSLKWSYMELIQQLFLDNWAKPLQDWCQKHELILTGHVLHEDSLGGQVAPCGSVMRYYEYLDYPGIDVLGSENRGYWIAKQVSSVARQQGRKWMLSELYGCTGWETDFARHKEIGDWQALFGINLRCHHLSWVTMEGEAKRDYPASISYQSAWHPEYEAVESYFSRFGVVMQAGVPECEILVINPIESLWAQIYSGWGTWLHAVDKDMLEVEAKYRDVFHWITQDLQDFDYGDEDHLKRYARVEKAGGTTRLRLGEASYRLVIVAGMETMRSSTLDLLKDFAKKGGRILFAGDGPSHIDARPAAPAAAGAKLGERVPFSREDFLEAVRVVVAPAVACVDTRGNPVAGLLAQVRRIGQDWILALVNTGQQELKDVTIRIPHGGFVQELDCLTGERFSVRSRSTAEGSQWEAEFADRGSLIFLVTPKQAELSPRPKFQSDRIYSLVGPYAYSLDEPNLCVLDFAKFSLHRDSWSEVQEILQIDRTIRGRLGHEQRSGTMVQPWARPKIDPGLGTPLKLRFLFDAEYLPKKIDLVIERPEQCRIVINGHHIVVPDVTQWLIDPCLRRVPIPVDCLHIGSNAVELHLDFRADTELEAIYLAGDFGVTLDRHRATLIELPATLEASDIVGQGLPFYSGRVRYQVPHPRVDQARAFRLEVPSFGGACVKVLDQGRKGLMPWPPYSMAITGQPDSSTYAVEVVCTRRNTFGPLHLTPREQPFYSPESFRSRGEDFDSEYQLFPTGLLAAPLLHQGDES